MTRVSIVCSSRFTLGVPLFALGLLFGPFGLGNAEASFAVCRSDPTITLSDGTQLTLYEDIAVSAASVRSITYQLRIPSGLSVRSIQYSGAVPSSLQRVTVAAD